MTGRREHALPHRSGFGSRGLRHAVAAFAMAMSAPAGAAAAPGLHRIVHVCDCPASMAGEEREGLLLEFARLGYVQAATSISSLTTS